ncbi:deoxyguanosinetriphosphate triphosphohydrolase [Rhodoferax aquaticus]|uniref:Deoxyguanosinetriphosphate triphosphohydrolase-like protein n=1 Tax=Rhodoferax aquaticus TaxID=2527691 RepID=A0A515ELK8_9BURK|nr:deoxyguanosinetriphosphate triphosphohydrolase [Rhodoferax aquaticus]QDL53531.1 deoxyguanosinetriphosphate triphosphohydrolase [Rhodoferax aquaticus]
MSLAVYASDPSKTRGRKYPESAAPTRTEYQRDRDRIVHSTAFRRLVYKTQVFLNHEGDLFRTRLTHSLEVAQLGRSIARTLCLNEDMVEAIALAHDLGHTPFGHAGQDALNECMQAAGGFEHNLQSLRVVDVLEQRYPAFNGLNLCFETRAGILKHCSRANALLLEAQEHRYVDSGGGVAARFLTRTQPSLEAQLCNLADAIAYNAHDMDDGVRSGLLTVDQLSEVPVFKRFHQQVLASHPHLAKASEARRLLYEVIRCMLSAQVYDVIETTKNRLLTAQPRSSEEVGALPPLVAFSEAMSREAGEMKSFLFAKLYRHTNVVNQMTLAKQVIRDLFAAYTGSPQEMLKKEGDTLVAEEGRDAAHVGNGDPRAVADYIAGMTDRFALKEHERMTGQKLFSA